MDLLSSRDLLSNMLILIIREITLILILHSRLMTEMMRRIFKKVPEP
jgi:hypothetical protein